MVLFMLLSLTCLLLSVLYLQFRWRYRHIIATANKLPCPPTWPFIGNALFFLENITSTTKHLLRFGTKFKTIFCIWVGPSPIFVTSNPSDLKILLNSSTTLEKDSSYNVLKIFLGNGLIAAPVTTWKKYRRLMDPLMHPSNIEHFLPVFNDIAKGLVEEIRGQSQPFDPTNLFFHAAINSISRTIITKKDVDMLTKLKIQKILFAVGSLYTESIARPWFQIVWLVRLLHSDSKRAIQYLFDVNMTYDKLCIEDVNGTNFIHGLEKGSDGFQYKTLWDVSLNNPNGPTDNHNWRDERSTMIGAGSDTIVSALTFVTVTLANHPDVQEKVQKEIQEVVGDSSDVTLADLNCLTYLEQVIMETLRLHGSVPIIMRQATKDTKLSTCTIPAGSRVMIPLFALGHNEDYFPEPKKFLPDRFSPEAARERHVYAFIPFSGGPRNCIGKRYSLMYMKTILVHMLRTFRVHTTLRLNDIEYEAKIVMFSKHKLPLEFECR
uniref:Cytochrome P450 n=1 Tax=Graphocephala atropunctata TaxID=36148 RepID=A0A1B6LRU3_9HEMI